MYRAGTTGRRRSQMCGGSLFGRDAASFDGVQPFQELAGEDQSPLPGGIGHCASRSREFLTRPTAKIAFIRFHVPLHEPRLVRVANRNLLELIHRSSPVRRRNEAPVRAAAAKDAAKGRRAAGGKSCN